jgi:hypothetical protein
MQNRTDGTGQAD